MDSNPLLENLPLPDFKRIEARHMEPAIDTAIANNLERLRQLVQQPEESWDALFPVLDDMDDRLGKTWSPISHLNSVANTSEIRNAYNTCLQKVSDYGNTLSQHVELYEKLNAARKSKQYGSLDSTKKKILEDALRDFRLAGVSLDKAEREVFRKLSNSLAHLQAKYEENILDATHAWTEFVSDASLLAGIPASDMENARLRAAATERDGWLLTLDYPCYHAVLTFAENRELRNRMYEAYSTRASDTGPHGGRFDNTVLMREILATRNKMAGMLGFDCYTSYSIETKMVRSAGEIRDFLQQLLARVRPHAEREFEELREFARQDCGIDDLEPWDIAFCTEKLRRQRFAIDQDAVRQYFPSKPVLERMFRQAGELYGLAFNTIESASTWHDDVEVFGITNLEGSRVGHLYTDLYARPGKRGGAWMDEYCGRKRLQGDLQTPVAYLVCNFSTPTNVADALLTHDDVVTLYHEFGHCLHHLLTTIDYPSAAGINGVEWDAVELPSQFHENFAWQPEVLRKLSRHVSTGEIMPDDLVKGLCAARNFHAGRFLLRQLEFAIFDLELYSRPEVNNPLQTWRDVNARVALQPLPDYHRFPHSFSHIFAGGYAAGYYGYLWAEVLACDAYDKVLTAVDPTRETRRFRKTVLERGGSRPAAELFQNFMQRPPDIAAFLRHHGIGD